MAQRFFILGCGKMGGALLAGWLAGDKDGSRDFIIIDPYFEKKGAFDVKAIHAFASIKEAAAAGYDKPDVMLLSVKPQMMAEALQDVHLLSCDDTCFISIAAGLSIAGIEMLLPSVDKAVIIRSMPNTPAAIGKGMTALIGNQNASQAHLDMAISLMQVSGLVISLYDESQMDAVTALSGSGPAYIFLMAEAMTKAGQSLGLSADKAQVLALQTIYGAANLLNESDEGASILRENVTSKGGTTAAALSVLMADDGLAQLMEKALAAAHARSIELGQ